VAERKPQAVLVEMGLMTAVLEQHQPVVPELMVAMLKELTVPVHQAELAAAEMEDWLKLEQIVIQAAVAAVADIMAAAAAAKTLIAEQRPVQAVAVVHAILLVQLPVQIVAVDKMQVIIPIQIMPAMLEEVGLEVIMAQPEVQEMEGWL
jgi:hypothetical protein